ncbi:hypothetical protein BSKO_13296 [Bryopsis sp. KO-2023]|nr:hypothetical protein BSKO_13296 [Bryopsis sp. KO-2023]
MAPGGAGLIPTREYRSSIDRVITRLGLKKPSAPTHKHIWTMHGIERVPVEAPPPRDSRYAPSKSQRFLAKRDPSDCGGMPPRRRSCRESHKETLFLGPGAKGVGRVSRNSRALEVLRGKMDAKIAGRMDCGTASSVNAAKGDFKLMSSTELGSVSTTLPSYTWRGAYQEEHMPDGKCERIHDEASGEPVSMTCIAWLQSKHKKLCSKKPAPQRHEPSIFGQLLHIGSRRSASLRRTNTCDTPPLPPSLSTTPPSTTGASPIISEGVKCGRKKNCVGSDPGPKSDRHIRHHHSDSAKDFYRHRCHRCGSFDFLEGSEKELRKCLESWRAIDGKLTTIDGKLLTRSNPCIGTSPSTGFTH